MQKFKVTMICKEIWRSEIIIETNIPPHDLENIKDLAWAEFDKNCKKDLEQNNYTKVEEIK